MKRILGIIAIITVSALVITSCAKKCNCTRYEDGVKVLVETYDNGSTRFFEKSVCESMSEPKYLGYSMVTEGKEVAVEYKCK